MLEVQSGASYTDTVESPAQHRTHHHLQGPCAAESCQHESQERVFGREEVGKKLKSLDSFLPILTLEGR